MPDGEELKPEGFFCKTITDNGSTKRVILEHTRINDFQITIRAKSGIDTLPNTYGDFKTGEIYKIDPEKIN